MIFRLTQKLATKIHAGPIGEAPMFRNQYADWSAHVFTAGRSQYILLSNTKSLYSCVMTGRGITDAATFVDRALETIGETMASDGKALLFANFIAPERGSVAFTKTLNRSVTGCMNDFITHARFDFEDKRSLSDIAASLNRTPLSPLANREGRRYASPDHAFKCLSPGDPATD